MLGSTSLIKVLHFDFNALFRQGVLQWGLLISMSVVLMLDGQLLVLVQNGVMNVRKIMNALLDIWFRVSPTTIQSLMTLNVIHVQQENLVMLLIQQFKLTVPLATTLDLVKWNEQNAQKDICAQTREYQSQYHEHQDTNKHLKLRQFVLFAVEMEGTQMFQGLMIASQCQLVITQQMKTQFLFHATKELTLQH